MTNSRTHYDTTDVKTFSSWPYSAKLRPIISNLCDRFHNVKLVTSIKKQVT